MPRTPISRQVGAPRRKARQSTSRSRKLRKRASPELARLGWAMRWLGILKYLPSSIQFMAGLMFVGALLLGGNWCYQIYHKPSELFFPVSSAFYKRPSATWQAYGALFKRNSTEVMTPTLLAALAQTEASGNPVARTYWRWSFAPDLLKIYRPASSAVGMFQITDGTFKEARQYCIRDHQVTRSGRWDDWRSCWFTGLYTRVLPSHAVELTAANLDRHVTDILAHEGLQDVSLAQKQDVAIITHLCGAGAAATFAARGLRLATGQHCGDHDVSLYLSRVRTLERYFRVIASRD